jgi:hypothetical protein
VAAVAAAARARAKFRVALRPGFEMETGTVQSGLVESRRTAVEASSAVAKTEKQTPVSAVKK